MSVFYIDIFNHPLYFRKMLFFSQKSFLFNVLGKQFGSLVILYDDKLTFGRELHREKTWARIHLVPLLTAENDRDLYRRHLAALAREREIMKDVPGWVVGESVYNSKRYVAPAVYMP